jgi:hypothetical protein
MPAGPGVFVGAAAFFNFGLSAAPRSGFFTTHFGLEPETFPAPISLIALKNFDLRPSKVTVLRQFRGIDQEDLNLCPLEPFPLRRDQWGNGK